jgi:hypothetical protein
MQQSATSDSLCGRKCTKTCINRGVCLNSRSSTTQKNGDFCSKKTLSYLPSTTKTRNQIFLGSTLMLHWLIYSTSWANSTVILDATIQEGWLTLSIPLCRYAQTEMSCPPTWNFQTTVVWEPWYLFSLNTIWRNQSN